MKQLAIIVAFLLSIFNARAQAPSKFFTRWGGGGHDVGYGVIQTLNGQYAVTGSTSSFGNGNTDVYLAIVDSMGWLRYQTSFGGFNNDIGQSIIQLADSGFVIAGYTNSFGSGGYDLYVVRTDKNCSLVWQQTIGGMDWDFGYKVLQSTDGGFVICGSTESYGYGKTDGYIVKLNAAGVFQWQKTYGGPEDDNFKSFVMTYNGMMAFAGTTKSMGDVKGDCWLFKTDLMGDSVLSVKYGNTYRQYVNDIDENPVTKNFIFSGAYDKDGLDSTAAMILCLDENGIFQFEDIHSYHEQKDEQYVSAVHIRNNEMYYIRKSQYSNVDPRLQPMLSHFNNNSYIAATKYGSLDEDELFQISRTRNKGAIAVGYTNGYNAQLKDIFMIKLDSNSVFGAADVVGMNESSNKPDDYLLFPSITDGPVNISSDIKELSKITIQDQLGRVVLETSIPKSQIDISSFNAGVYFFTLCSKNEYRTYKVIKTD
jgi:hypothetical protein